VVYDFPDQTGQFNASGISLNGTFSNDLGSLPSFGVLANAGYNYGFFQNRGGVKPVAYDVEDGEIQALLFGQEISSASIFSNLTAVNILGYFSTDSPNYIGLKMTIGGNDHYGWFEIVGDGENLVLTRFAFNNVAGQSILAGQTTAVPEASTLGLVGGLFGLVAAAHVRRRRAKQAAASDKFLALAAGEKLN